MRIFFIKWAVTVLLVFFFVFYSHAIKESWAMEGSKFKEAQELVDNMVSKHPDLLRLTIHAVPTGKEGSRIIACNIREKIGAPSDPEDLEVLKTNKIVVLREGDNLDVTAPIRDKAGKPIAASGITLRFRKGETENKLIEKAKSIANEVTTTIQSLDKLLW
ncbi:MAG: hypothetical protein KAV83_09360 [Desulfobacterales bacterium]|nr:hypothetical protein [Desulfobacterales bacterium]